MLYFKYFGFVLIRHYNIFSAFSHYLFDFIVCGDFVAREIIYMYNVFSDASYEYAVPELGGSVPLLAHENSLARSENSSVFSSNSAAQAIKVPIPKPPSSRTSEESAGSRGKRVSTPKSLLHTYIQA